MGATKGNSSVNINSCSVSWAVDSDDLSDASGTLDVVHPDLDIFGCVTVKIGLGWPAMP